MDSFNSYIPLTSTPKRSNKSSYAQPLSSTLSTSNHSYQKMDLSVSAITFIKKSSSSSHQKKRRQSYHRRRTHIHSSTIIKRIELKHLLYSTRAMKYSDDKQHHYTDNDMKIYVV
ncbi:hypothetical protein I4U23_013792 [Adineta vaga]|nr:hypothetical protein I4U23_013792 [Adineta vaga]